MRATALETFWLPLSLALKFGFPALDSGFDALECVIAFEADRLFGRLEDELIVESGVHASGERALRAAYGGRTAARNRIRDRACLAEHGLHFDRAIREELMMVLKSESWPDMSQLNVVVLEGTVHFWGLVNSDAQSE